MTERGFIALARGFLAHPVVGVERGKPFSRSEAWEWLLFEAAYKPRRYDAGQHVIELQRGQLAHSTRYMAKAWRWPETNVRRFLKRLKTGAGTGAMIGAESGAGITVITICNYDKHQPASVDSGAEDGAPNGATTGAKVAHERRRKEQGNNLTREYARERAGEPEGFSEWYSVYPRRTQRKAASRAFAKITKAGEIPLADLMDRTRRFAATWAAKPKAEIQFCPYPASWLNSGEYLDEAQPPAGQPGAMKITAPDQRDPKTFTESDWRDRLSIIKSGGEWPKQFWGPPPGADGCLVPGNLIEGIQQQ